MSPLPVLDWTRNVLKKLWEGISLVNEQILENIDHTSTLHSQLSKLQRLRSVFSALLTRRTTPEGEKDLRAKMNEVVYLSQVSFFFLSFE